MKNKKDFNKYLAECTGDACGDSRDRCVVYVDTIHGDQKTFGGSCVHGYSENVLYKVFWKELNK